MSTPDVVESPFGPLWFFDGVPTTESVHRIYDALDLIRATQIQVSSTIWLACRG
jgi:hypothetical protein